MTIPTYPRITQFARAHRSDCKLSLHPRYFYATSGITFAIPIEFSGIPFQCLCPQKDSIHQ
jgi:hypothetical protein